MWESRSGLVTVCGVNVPPQRDDLVISQLEWDVFAEAVRGGGGCNLPPGAVGQLMLGHLIARGWVHVGEGTMALTSAGWRVATARIRIIYPGGVAIPRSALE